MYSIAKEYHYSHVLQLDMTRDAWEKLCEPLLMRTMAPIQIILDGNMMSEADIDEVVLVGGSSRIPWIQVHFEAMIYYRYVASIFPSIDMIYHILLAKPRKTVFIALDKTKDGVSRTFDSSFYNDIHNVILHTNESATCALQIASDSISLK
jgi:molecular chaperone DnaK (HSP70)